MYKLSKLIITLIAIVSILCCVPVASAVDATEPTEPTEEIRIPIMATGPKALYSDPEELPEEPSEQEDNHDAICFILLAIGIPAGCIVAQGFSFWKW